MFLHSHLQDLKFGTILAGQSLQGSGSLHGSPSMQRLGSAGGLGTTGGMPGGVPPAGIMRSRSQQQPGMLPFTQGPGQGQMVHLQMSQGLRLDPSPSPHQQRDPAMFQRSFSPAVGGMNVHGQGSLMSGGLIPGSASARQLGQQTLPPMAESAVPAWQQMRPTHDAQGAQDPENASSDLRQSSLHSACRQASSPLLSPISGTRAKPQPRCPFTRIIRHNEGSPVI